MDERFAGRQLHLESRRHRHAGGGLDRRQPFGHRDQFLRLSRLEFLFGDLHQLVPQDVRPLHPTGHDVGQLVTIKITHCQLPTDARFVIGEVRHPVDALLAADQLEPICHRAGIPQRRLAVMRPIGLACHNVLQAVTVDVVQSHRVRLGEQHAVGTVLGLLSHDQVFFEGDLISVLQLLKPSQAKRVGGQTGDHIVVAVAVNVVGEHVGPAKSGELELVECPQRIALDRFRLLVPATLRDDIVPAIAVDITHSQSMPEGILAHFGRDGMPRPRVCGLHVKRRVAKLATVIADQLGLSVSDQLYELWRLVADSIQNLAGLPVF